MRKSFYQFLFMAAFMLLPLTASAVEIGGINYVFNVSNKTAEVTNKAYQGSVVIPDDVTYNWVKFRVTGIAGKALWMQWADLCYDWQQCNNHWRQCLPRL